MQQPSFKFREDRRRAARLRVLKAALIQGDAMHYLCTVRNISELGACLEAESTKDIPGDFQLAIQGADSQACRVIWRDERRLGVMFQKEAGFSVLN